MSVATKFLYGALFEPGRQILFLTFRVLRKLASLSEKGHQKYTRLLRLAPFYDAFYTETGLRREVQRYYDSLEAVLDYLPLHPKVSILMPVYQPRLEFLQQALASVALQLYPNWELCVVDDASGDPELDLLLEAFAKSHPGKVHYRKRSTNGHIAKASQDCLDMATGEYVA